jgi:D-lactate dehydrogenase
MPATRVAVFSTKRYDEESLSAARESGGFDVELVFFEARLTETTAALARGFPVVCAFVNDELTRPVLQELADHGTRLIALRSAGFNNVDLGAAAGSA